VSLRDLLSHPRIWRGRDGDSVGAVTVPTGFQALDDYLPGGGWPLKAITEIFVERYGVGELSLLMPALASLDVERQWIVWIAPPFVPYAPALLRCGLDLSRILLVHPSRSKKDDVLWVTEQAIRSRSTAVALAWIEETDTTALRRMQLGAEECGCWTVLFRPMTAAGESSPAALRLRLSSAPAGETAAVPHGGALQSRIDILKCRGRRPRTISIDDSTLRDRACLRPRSRQ